MGTAEHLAQWGSPWDSHGDQAVTTISHQAVGKGGSWLSGLLSRARSQAAYNNCISQPFPAEWAGPGSSAQGFGLNLSFIFVLVLEPKGAEGGEFWQPCCF